MKSVIIRPLFTIHISYSEIKKRSTSVLFCYSYSLKIFVTYKNWACLIFSLKLCSQIKLNNRQLKYFSYFVDFVCFLFRIHKTIYE